MEAKLEAFDRARIEATRLSAARVVWHLEWLWSLPLEEREEDHRPARGIALT